MRKKSRCQPTVRARRRLHLILRCLGPRGTLIALAAPGWITLGIGTVAGFSGKPQDAPHLLIPEDIRGWALWIVPGLLALALVAARREQPQRLAVALLSLGPMVRAFSYSWAWWAWLLSDDGASSGFYAAAAWWLLLLLVTCMVYAPDTWHYLGDDRERRERRERGDTA